MPAFVFIASTRWAGLATDDMLTKIGSARDRLGGWIVDADSSDTRLIYYDNDPREPKALYVAQFDGGGRLLSGRVLGRADDRVLSPANRRMIAAKDAAIRRFAATPVTACSSQPYNIIPIRGVLYTSVYFLVPRTDMKTMPMGGHYVVRVWPDGSASAPEAFTRTCAEVPIAQTGGDRTRALVVTHDLTPTPTEIHVYASLSMKLPIAVSTTQNQKTWWVEGERIERLDPTASRAPPPAPSPPPQSAPMTVRAAPSASVWRGQLLHAYDAAAALATADFLKKAPDAAELTAGWIVDGTVEAMDVIFANEDRHNPRTVYSARIERGVLVRSRVYREGSAIGMTPTRRRMLEARYTAAAALRAHGRKYCSPGPPNTVVLPPERDDEPMLVYFLSPRPERDMVPMGGHYRVPVSTVDGRAGQVESFPGCDLIDARKRPLQGDVPTLTFDTDEHNSLPNEFHVYAAIALGDELHVHTTRNGMNWTVTRDRIRPDGAPEPRPKPVDPRARRIISRR